MYTDLPSTRYPTRTLGPADSEWRLEDAVSTEDGIGLRRTGGDRLSRCYARNGATCCGAGLSGAPRNLLRFGLIHF